MLQAPFGPIGPGWMTTPSPGLPWPSTSIGTVGSLYGSLQPGGFNSTVEGGVPGALQMAGQAQASGMAFGSSPLGWGMSPAALSTAFSIPDGVTASSLLMGIALRRGQPQGPTSDQDVEPLGEPPSGEVRVVLLLISFCHVWYSVDSACTDSPWFGQHGGIL